MKLRIRSIFSDFVGDIFSALLATRQYVLASLFFLIFDQSYYYLTYADVRNSAFGAARLGGVLHFLKHGRAERRVWRATPFGLRWLSSRFAVIRVTRNEWSGLRFSSRPSSGPPKGGEVVLVPLRPSKAHWIRLPFSADTIENEGEIQLNWRPVIASGGHAYLMFVRQGARLLAFSTQTNEAQFSGGLIYSPGQMPWPLPRAICVSFVTQCNLNCIHCISRTTRSSVNVLPDRNWAEIEAGIAAGVIHSLSADFSGDILFASRKHGPFLDRLIGSGAPLRFDTHANDLNDVAADKLLASRLTSINFSLDAMTDPTYRKIRRGGRPIEEVLDNISRFMAKKRQRRPDVITYISFAIMRSNIDEIELAIDFAAKSGIDYVQCNHLMVFTEDMVEESLLLYPERYARRRREILDHAKKPGAIPKVVLPEAVVTNKPRNGHRPCDFPFVAVMVLGDGDVMACCMPGSSIGNLAEASLGEIWNGPRSRAFRSRVNSDDPPAICNTCPIYRFGNNFRSYVPGLPAQQQAEFEARCIELRSSTQFPGATIN